VGHLGLIVVPALLLAWVFLGDIWRRTDQEAASAAG
jgi:hypothetical protein